MASQYTQLDASLPVTLVTDTSPSKLQANESPDLHNVVTKEPDQVRLRRGFRRELPLFAVLPSYATDVLTAQGVVGDKVLLSYHSPSGTPWYPVYYGVPPSGTTSTATMTGVVLNRNPTTGAITTDGLLSESMFGRTVNYEHGCYGIKVIAGSRRHRQFSGANFVTDVGLMKWAGRNNLFSGPVSNPRVNIVNGVTGGTFVPADAPTSSVTGMYMIVEATATNKPLAGYWYTYRVAEHTAGSVNFTLDRPYGLGESSTNVPTLNGSVAAADRVVLAGIEEVANSPLGATTVGLFHERLFTGAGHILPAVGSYSGYYPNLLSWSEPGQPEKWPSQNFLIVDDDFGEFITGLGTVGQYQVIFKRNKMLIMSGTDETSFVVDDFSDKIGCAWSGSIMNHEDKLIWAGEDGIYAFDGETLDEITQPEPGRGIKKKYRSRMSKDNGQKTRFYQRYPWIHSVKDDTLVVQLGDAQMAQREEPLVYNTRTKQWATWGRKPTDTSPIVNDLTVPESQPTGFFTCKEIAYAVLGYSIVRINDCWEFEQDGPITTSLYDTLDEFHRHNDAPVTSPVPGVIQLPDLRLGDGDTVRVKEIAVEHNCHFAASPQEADKAAWAVTLAADPLLTTPDISYDVLGRWTNGGAGYPTTVTPLHDLTRTDRFPDAFSLEGHTFRVRLTTHATNAMLSHKLFKVRLLLEPTKTRLNRNQ